MKTLIRILVAAFIFLPQLVKGQQRALPALSASSSDSLKQISEQTPLKPTLTKYDYYNTLGVACKAEIKLEKATKIPFRFRLGSLQQTDYLEGKPNAQKPENR